MLTIFCTSVSPKLFELGATRPDPSVYKSLMIEYSNSDISDSCNKIPIISVNNEDDYKELLGSNPVSIISRLFTSCDDFKRTDEPVVIGRVRYQNDIVATIIIAYGPDNLISFMSSDVGDITLNVVDVTSSQININEYCSLSTLTILNVFRLAAIQNNKRLKNNQVFVNPVSKLRTQLYYATAAKFSEEWSKFFHVLIARCNATDYINFYDVLGLINGESKFDRCIVQPGKYKAEGLFQIEPATQLGYPNSKKFFQDWGVLRLASPSAQLTFGLDGILSYSRGANVKDSKGRFKLRQLNWFPAWAKKNPLDSSLQVGSTGGSKSLGSNFLATNESVYCFLSDTDAVGFGKYSAASTLFARGNKNAINSANLGYGFTDFLTSIIDEVPVLKKAITASEERCKRGTSSVDTKTNQVILKYPVTDGDVIVLMRSKNRAVDITEGITKWGELSELDITSPVLPAVGIPGVVQLKRSVKTTSAEGTSKNTDEVSVAWMGSRESIRTDVEIPNYVTYCFGVLFKLKGTDLESKVLDEEFSDWTYNVRDIGRSNRSVINRMSIRIMAFLDYGLQRDSIVVYEDGGLLATIREVTGLGKPDVQSLSEMSFRSFNESSHGRLLSFPFNASGVRIS